MRFSLVSASALLALTVAATGAVKIDFNVHRGLLNARVRRADLATLSLTNEQTYYSADLKLGSDAQEVSVLIDTGSLDLWVMLNDVLCSASSSYSKRDTTGHSKRRVLDVAKVFAEYELANNAKRAVAASLASGNSSNLCTQEGSFDTATSDSFSANSSAGEFSITYADGTTATGIWGTDYVYILGTNVSDVSFAVVNDTSSEIGVLGIGLEGLESTYPLETTDYMYENFPVRLKSTGAIKKVAYSLYLNDESALSGQVLFGAVDHAKYSGQLTTVPLVNIYPQYYDNPVRFDVALDSISLQTDSTNVTVINSSMAALLDSGTTYTYLPTEAFENFVSALSGTYSQVGYYLVSCDYYTEDAYAVFDFSGATIKVPFTDLIFEYGSSCYLAILEQDSETSYAVLGDNFLRHAYVVYDLEDYEISLAQASYSSDEDIEVILSSVPLAVAAEYYSSTSLADSTASSEVSKLSSSLLKKSAASRASFPLWSIVTMVAGLVGFVLV